MGEWISRHRRRFFLPGKAVRGLKAEWVKAVMGRQLMEEKRV
jgi:hypothetical protein